MVCCVVPWQYACYLCSSGNGIRKFADCHVSNFLLLPFSILEVMFGNQLSIKWYHQTRLYNGYLHTLMLVQETTSQGKSNSSIILSNVSFSTTFSIYYSLKYIRKNSWNSLHIFYPLPFCSSYNWKQARDISINAHNDTFWNQSWNSHQHACWLQSIKHRHLLEQCIYTDWP